jgi:hypothetical protein
MLIGDLNMLHHAAQWVNICAWAGCANGLKAGSQPTRLFLDAGFSFLIESRRLGWTAGNSGSLSPLASRLTEMATPAALFTGLVKAQMAPAIRQLRIEAATKFFTPTPVVPFDTSDQLGTPLCVPPDRA